MTQVRNHQGPPCPPPAGPLRVEVVAGDRLLSAIGPHYDDLAAAAHVPVTNRRPWLDVWCGTHPEIEPWAALAWRGDRLDAAILLGRRWRDGVLEVVSVGHGRNDRSRFPARDDVAAAAAAGALAQALATCDAPWELRVEQLPPGDIVAGALATALPGAELLAGGNVPRVEFHDDRELDHHLSKNLRRQLRKCRNRLAEDGVEPTMEFVRDRAALGPVLDEVEAVHRGRDHAVGRRSDIDDPTGLALWRGAIERHIELDAVEIAVLRVGAQMVAYVVSLLDHDVYRVLDGRFETAWERYSPGRLLETATLGHAMEDPRFRCLDWMNSVAPDKLIAANEVEPTVHLVARSASEAGAEGLVPAGAVADRG
jgi:CelD/BcsL family acetyltransferase involved in cellulose biosynthesis